jgi:hypothetical protein
MQSAFYTLRRIMIGTVIMLALMGVLATCGSEDKKDNKQEPSATPVPAATSTPTATRTPAAPTFTPGPGTVYPTVKASATVEPTLTPWPTATITATFTADEALLADAIAYAQTDMVARINILPDQIEVVDPELVVAEDLVCPIPAAEDITVSMLYMRYENLIYPYQYYTNGTLVVEACETTLTDASILVASTPDVRVNVLQGIRADLQARGVDSEAGQYNVVEMTWTDEALGCPGQDVPPAEIPGYVITYTLNNVTYEYHTDDTGSRIVVCPPPQGFETADAFIETLVQTYPEYVSATEDTMQLRGLDVEGRVITVTDRLIPIGVFEFASPDEARQAAKYITDSQAEARFVIGSVLAVMTDESTEIYALLSAYGQAVR